MQSIRKAIIILAIICLPAVLSTSVFAQSECKAVYGQGAAILRLATGSPGELGLVEVLAKAFNETHDAQLCWKKAGSGASLKLLKEKKVDFVMVHAPAAEKLAVAKGWAIERHLIGSNEFYIVGPKNDPAAISTAGSASEAYRKIADAKSKFFSRGDNSGTHKKEMAIWEKVGIQPSGAWYVVTKTFMMATLKMADADHGYFMTDSSTWVAAKKDLKHLKILFRGDPFLINTYHTLCQPDGATAGQPLAVQFIDFVISEKGQKLLRDYGVDRYGEGLYNDAAYARQYDH